MPQTPSCISPARRQVEHPVLWFFVKGRRIIAVHGIRTKGQTIPARDLGAARERMRDWKESNEL